MQIICSIYWLFILSLLRYVNWIKRSDFINTFLEHLLDWKDPSFWTDKPVALISCPEHLSCFTAYSPRQAHINKDHYKQAGIVFFTLNQFIGKLQNIFAAFSNATFLQLCDPCSSSIGRTTMAFIFLYVTKVNFHPVWHTISGNNYHPL